MADTVPICALAGGTHNLFALCPANDCHAACLPAFGSVGIFALGAFGSCPAERLHDRLLDLPTQVAGLFLRLGGG